MNNATQKAPKPIDEAAIAAKVEQDTRHPGIKPGRKLPDDFENPKAGESGHLCVSPSPHSLYRPDWFQVIIHQIDDSIPTMQYFCTNGKEWYVKTGTWVDCPREIVNHLTGSAIDVIEQNYTAEDLRVGRPATRIVRRVPRFAYTAIGSA